MINKKGQAAMEFLMTYGWALLVVLVAIGALAFFGVLNPGQFLPEVCTIPAGLLCADHEASIDDGISLSIQNGLGKALTGVTLAGTGCTVEAGVPIPSGDTATITCGTGGLTGYNPGDNLNGQDIALTLAYTVDQGLTHAKLVNLITKVSV